MIALRDAKRDFSIVFRTFGDDLKSIIREFNAFCTGEHPCFNGKNNTPLVKFDGSNGSKDYRIERNQQGFMERNMSQDLQDCTLLIGEPNRK